MKTATIVAFCCENSAYKAVAPIADSPALESVDIVKLPCSGKVETGLVLKCLEDGHAGVLVLACPLDNCKYVNGNYRTRKRVEVAQRTLEEAGVDRRRVRIAFVSSVDTHKIASLVEEMKRSLSKGKEEA